MTPHDVLREDQRQALEAAKGGGADSLHRMLRRAAKELESRLRALEGAGHGGNFTAVRMRATLGQIQHVVTGLQRAMRSTLVDQAGGVAERSAQNLVKYLHVADKAFRGIGAQPLRIEEASMFDAARHGAQASLLRRIGTDPDHPGRPGVLERYGLATIQHFEQSLQRHVLMRSSVDDVQRDLVAKSPFLQGVPASWAQRIARTELHGVANRAHWEGIREADTQLGDMVKILSAVFDERTAADSYSTHGQCRRPEEAFATWYGLRQHPPDRPNDRSVVTPHRISWPIPTYLFPKTRDEVVARWKHDGRSGTPPPTPKITTIPFSLFGKDAK